MTPGDLAKLLRLRRHREEKAMNIVVARGNTLACAQQELAAANQAVLNHAQQSRLHEQQSLAQLMGHELHPHDLINLQSDLNAREDRRQDLLAAENQAIDRRDGCQTNLNTAREEFRRRHAQAEKMSGLIEQMQVRENRRQLMLAESASDEGHLAGSPSVPASPPANASESGDA